MTQTDDELIRRSQAGDPTAFEQLIFRYDRNVLAIAARFTQNSDDAKDIYQESLIRVYKGLAGFEHKSEFTTWLYRIVTNVCLTFKERKRRLNTVSLQEEKEEAFSEIPSGGPGTDAGLHGEEIDRRIRSALQELSPKQRLVFTLRHYQEYKVKEIAVMMECAEGTVKKYLFEATQKMRDRLHDLYE